MLVFPTSNVFADESKVKMDKIEYEIYNGSGELIDTTYNEYEIETIIRNNSSMYITNKDLMIKGSTLYLGKIKKSAATAYSIIEVFVVLNSFINILNNTTIPCADVETIYSVYSCDGNSLNPYPMYSYQAKTWYTTNIYYVKIGIA
jgi:hypothetical protein